MLYQYQKQFSKSNERFSAQSQKYRTAKTVFSRILVTMGNYGHIKKNQSAELHKLFIKTKIFEIRSAVKKLRTRTENLKFKDSGICGYHGNHYF